MTNVELKSRAGASLGITALILGIVSFLICWVPFVGCFAIPVALTGLILAIVGAIVAGRRGGQGIGFSIGGGILSLIALAVSLVFSFAIASAMHQVFHPGAGMVAPSTTAPADDHIAQAIKKFEVQRAAFKYSDDQMAEPEITMSVRNGTGIAVSHAYFHGTLSSPGRTIPWVDNDFNYEIPGGLEPGESATWHLGLNSFGPWGKAPHDRNDFVFTVRVTRIDGAGGKSIYDVQ